jgi:hypothetical protein
LEPESDNDLSVELPNELEPESDHSRSTGLDYELEAVGSGGEVEPPPPNYWQPFEFRSWLAVGDYVWLNHWGLCQVIEAPWFGTQAVVVRVETDTPVPIRIEKSCITHRWAPPWSETA